MKSQPTTDKDRIVALETELAALRDQLAEEKRRSTIYKMRWEAHELGTPETIAAKNAELAGWRRCVATQVIPLLGIQIASEALGPNHPIYLPAHLLKAISFTAELGQKALVRGEFPDEADMRRVNLLSGTATAERMDVFLAAYSGTISLFGRAARAMGRFVFSR